MKIEIHEPSFSLGPFCFIHDAPKNTEDEFTQLADTFIRELQLPERQNSA
jgi:hypothetical protein